jgi:Spy/CpxP family protein refolding chaperone
MGIKSKGKWQVRVAALFIFLLGVAAGALAPRAYHAWVRRSDPPARQGRFERMFERLQLTAEQKAQVQQILGDTREQLEAVRRESEPRVREIRQQTDERLRQVLTPEQWQQFQQMRDETRATNRRGRRGNNSSPPAER